MNPHRDKAVTLLTHYLLLLMERPGTRQLKVDADTHKEIAEIIDEVIEAAVETIREETAETER